VSHHIYQTEGVILGGFNVGESNRFLYIFTKDLGVVGASVQGVRELKSKLRYSLQDFSYSKVDLVHGRQVWRVTNAQQVRDMGMLVKNEYKRKVFVNIVSLLKRLCVGEGVHDGMFEEVLSGLLFLVEKNITKEELRFFEVILVLKILNYLGYWGENEKFAFFVSSKEWNKKILHEMSPFFAEALHEVNNALKESHL
jgi:DNA repair protein RecO